jgi:transcriptional regulator with XRE-family HTH domain
MASLATRLTQLRLQSGQSLQEVAAAVAVSKAHVWELEKGRAANPAMKLVERLAGHYKVTVAFLIGEDPDAVDADPDATRLYRLAREMDPADRALLDDMARSLIKRRQDSQAS